MRILITGGTGSLGQALVERWHKTHDLTILSRNPHKQQAVMEKFGLTPSAFVLADICNYEAVRDACFGQEVLIHAAALKVVSQGEQFLAEYHRVNSIGSQVVAKAWAKATRSDAPALYINSDKAVEPINFYGISKAIGEGFFINRGFSSLRYGNVVASEGSFIHKWKELLKRGKPLPVRFPFPTRFFLSFDQAIDLIENCLEAMDQDINGVFVPGNLRGFSILDVAEAMTAKANICRSNTLQIGEKQHEVLINQGEVIYRLKDNSLCLAEPGWGTFDYGPFNSQTAPRMTGVEVLKELGISPQQEVFA